MGNIVGQGLDRAIFWTDFGEELNPNKAAKAGRQVEVDALIRAGASVDMQDVSYGNTRGD